jgi:hypothetical protein
MPQEGKLADINPNTGRGLPQHYFKLNIYIIKDVA